MLLVIYIYPLISKLYFNEPSALIASLGAPPYNDSLFPRELPILYTRLSSRSRPKSFTIKGLPSTLPMLPIAPHLNKLLSSLLFLSLYKTNKA
jgi:hypothetical protein